ncbi:hypothetical protein BW723_10365 [Polaribacter reichenbachii]|uniref:Uncharacterized protein n=1 Tax=Polaribacter reichenbachii TaxID=996801 RepID=A0A1B8TNK6_9FLAO|nr:hypothetical protein BW723_10365 [Polaribacter reichenbachii]AUC17311.1 hypothetical protein BTO17_00810 [Polaribacter reichenbachii]OBY61241.1 hypothetical protein LPB301_17390 [Polaribacter reichenbachii]
MKLTLKLFQTLVVLIIIGYCKYKNDVKKKKVKEENLFTLLSNNKTNIHFKNTIKKTTYFML